MRYYLGIDNGGTSTKAAIYDMSGKEIGIASTETKVIIERPGYVERDLDEMREANLRVIRDVLLDNNIKGQDIAGIACCGHGKGLYLVDKEGKSFRNGIVSTDNRAWEYVEEWKKNGTAEAVFKKTFQQILSCQPVALLAWLKEHEPETMANIGWIFECKDYVRYILTGEAYGELTDYSGANLVNLTTKAYDQSLLELFGLESIREQLPPLRNSLDQCGSITHEVAEATGLKSGTPVFAGMFDIDACAIAVDAAKEDKICMIAGTWSINEYIRSQPVTDSSIAMNSIFCIPEYYLIEESSPTSAVNNEWFIKTFLSDLNIEHENIYETVNQWVASIPIEEFCPIFLPFLMASNVHPNGKGSFVGMTTYHNRKHMVKSVYEGIAFSHRYHLEKLLQSRDKAVTSIRLAGGVAKSKEWVKIFADVMKFPIEVVNIGETGTLGCAMNVAVGLGDYKDYQEAATHMISVVTAVEPNKYRSDIYDKRYAGYISLIESLDGFWSELHTIMED